MKISNQKLKNFRQQKGLTKQKIAEMLGYTLSLYEKVEDGRATASASFMRKFKAVFPDVSIDSIFFN